jgi:flagellar export protein FliJ
VATRFRFRLESLLKLRHSLEEVAQRTLARTLTLRDQAQAHLAEQLLLQAATIESRGTPRHAAVDLERWRAIERFLLVLERRIAAGRDQLREAEARVAAARQELLRAHRAHLMLVRLKERRQEQHALETLREEARDMDEMAVLRYRLGPGNGPSAREVPQ